MLSRIGNAFRFLGRLIYVLSPVFWWRWLRSMSGGGGGVT